MPDVSGAVALLALILGLPAMLAGAVAVIVNTVRRRDLQRARDDLAAEERRHAATRLERDELRAQLHDEVDRNVRQQNVNADLAARVETYDRTWRALEGPVADLKSAVERNHAEIVAHNERAIVGIRRIVGLVAEVMRQLGDHRSASTIVAEAEDRDL